MRAGAPPDGIRAGAPPDGVRARMQVGVQTGAQIGVQTGVRAGVQTGAQNAAQKTAQAQNMAQNGSGGPVGTGLALALAVGLATALATGMATALRADPDGWALDTLVTQEFRGASNPDLDDEDSSPEFRATTRLNATLTRESTISSLRLSAGFAPVIARDAPDDAIGFLAPSVTAALAHALSPRATFTGSLRASLTSTAFTENVFGFDEEGEPDLTDPTLTTGTAIRASLTGQAGLQWEATPRDAMGVSLRVNQVDFFDGSVDLVPSRSLALNSNWARALTPRLNGGLSAQLLFFEADNLENPRSIAFTVTAGGDYAVTQRLSSTFGLGVSITDTSEREIVGDLAGPRRSSTDLSFNGQLGLTYDGVDDQISLSLGQGLQPSTLGSLQNTTSFILRYTHNVNRDTTVGLDTRLQLQADLGDTAFSDANIALRISPFYTYQLTEETELRLGYSLELSDDADSDRAISHAVFLTLSRALPLLQ